jgi:hypothetical protein
MGSILIGVMIGGIAAIVGAILLIRRKIKASQRRTSDSSIYPLW